MKAILVAAILFPITFLIFSYLFDDPPTPIKGKKNHDSVLAYTIECQYNTHEKSTSFEVCPPPTIELK